MPANDQQVVDSTFCFLQNLFCCVAASNDPRRLLQRRSCLKELVDAVRGSRCLALICGHCEQRDFRVREGLK